MIMSWIFSKRKIYTEFTFQETEFNTLAADKIRLEVGDYVPPWWYNSHIGSLIQFGSSVNLIFEREIFILPDGSTFGVDWFPRRPSGLVTEKISLHLPGLGLSSDANVSQIFAKTFADAGYISGILIPRGLGGIPLVNIKLWNAGRTDDIKFVIDCLYKRFASIPASLFLSGFSASSSIVTKALLELAPSLFIAGDHLHVIGAMGCCVMFDYEETRTKLEASFLGSFYSFLLAIMNIMILDKNTHIHNKMDPSVLYKMKSALQLGQFDSAAHTMNGFLSEKEMCSQISSLPGIQTMPVPFLSLQPRDDPLHNYSSLDVTNYTVNQRVIFMETSHGNHFGFYEGSSIFDAFRNTTSYTYPARVALSFSNSCMGKK